MEESARWLARSTHTMNSSRNTVLPTTYAPLLSDLKARVRAAQVKAAAVNRELISPGR